MSKILQNNSLYKFILKSVNNNKNNVFINPYEDNIKPIYYADLERHINMFQGRLEDNGVLCGDRVAIFSHNSTVMALLFLSIIANGRSCVPINPKSGVTEVLHILSLSNVKHIFADIEYKNYLDGIVTTIKITYFESSDIYIDSLFNRMTNPLSIIEVSEESEAEIVFTSGSTGLPKGVVLTHKNLTSNAFSLASRYKINQSDNFLVSSPIFHNSGQIFSILTALFSGASITPVRSENALLQFWHLIDKFEITWTLSMTDFLRVLLAREERPLKDTVRGIVIGGSKTSYELVERFESYFSINVYQCYGLTETTSISACESPNDDNRVVGSAGTPLEGCTMSIMDNGIEVGPNEKGEVWISGNNVFKEYLNAKELTGAKKSNGWLKTGDIGVKNELGYITIIDRIDNMIIVGGENVYPSEIETIALKLEGIEQAIAIGIDDPYLGKKIILVCKLKKNHTVNINLWACDLRRHLSQFKVPKNFLSLNEIGLTDWPRSANLKILRHELTDIVEGYIHKNVNS